MYHNVQCAMLLHYISCSVIIVMYVMIYFTVSCTPGSYQTLHMVSVEETHTVVNLLTPICTPCPKGYYQNKQGQLKCKKCPNGFTTRNISSQLPEDCQKQCNLGYYSLDGFEPCLKCPNGTSSALRGSTVCSNCTEFDYTNGGFCDPSTCEHCYY